VEVPPGALIRKYKTFLYQITPVSGFAPVFVQKEMKNRRFIIGSEKKVEKLKVHWEVRGDEKRK
jgi:hypothetical protein